MSIFFARRQVRGGRSRARQRPSIERLEGRLVLSSFRLHTSAVIPHAASVVWQPNPPRTGGLAVQSGSVVSCFVGEPKMNEVQVVDDGSGDVQMSWNSGQPHAFQGVTTSVIQAQRARTNLFEIDDFSFDIEQSIVDRKISDLSFGLEKPILVRTSGHAVQTNSILTLTVNRPRTNVVQITNEGAGNAQVEWNGGPVHSFSGVGEILVNTRNARKDQVTLSDAVL